MQILIHWKDKYIYIYIHIPILLLKENKEKKDGRKRSIRGTIFGIYKANQLQSRVKDILSMGYIVGNNSNLGLASHALQ